MCMEAALIVNSRYCTHEVHTPDFVCNSVQHSATSKQHTQQQTLSGACECTQRNVNKVGYSAKTAFALAYADLQQSGMYDYYQHTQSHFCYGSDATYAGLLLLQ